MKKLIISYFDAIVGIFLLIIPTIWSMGHSIWLSSEQSQGFFILGMALWMFWNKWKEFDAIPFTSNKMGWGIIIPGLIAYVVGRTQQIWLFEVGSLLLIIAGYVVTYKSIQGLKCFIYPILFLVFIIPLPGFIVDSLTGLLKQNISDIAEHVLYAAGYPIARTGVTLTIGQYQLLVADACSGMHSLFSLLSLGFFYLYIQEGRSKLQKLLFMTFIVPIAIFANILRVITLVLITYYEGDEVGQGFIHDFSGLFLFSMALVSLYFIDKVIGSVGVKK